MSEPTTNAQMIDVMNTTIGVMQDNQAQTVAAVAALYGHNTDANAHGLNTVIDDLQNRTEEVVSELTSDVDDLILQIPEFGCFIGQWVSLRSSEPPAGFYVRNGALIENASTTVPFLVAYLQQAENQEQCITQEEWTAMQAATYTLSDYAGTEVPIWNGIGGVPYFVLDTEADTLRLPDTRGMFSEDAGFDGLTVGGAHGDMIRNIIGRHETADFGAAESPSGAFLDEYKDQDVIFAGTTPFWRGAVSFIASRVVPTGNANKPRGYGMLGCIYAG